MGPLDVLQWVGETLDKPGAAVRGLLAGRPDQLANLIPFSDTLGITDPRSRTYGRDLLEQYGLLGDNTPGLDAGDVAGFGVDMLTDPLNWIGGIGFAKKLVGANRANRSSQAMRAAGAMPEELIPLTKAVDESGKPIRTYSGTSSVFDDINVDLADQNNLYGKGYYTTSDPVMAESYIKKSGDEILWQNKMLNDAIEAKMSDLRHGRGPDRFLNNQAMNAQERLLKNPEPRGNIRQQFLDLRNPLYPDKTYSADEVAEIMARAESATPLSGEQTGESLFRYMVPGKKDTPENLRKFGFDSIVHRGGQRMGGVGHNVYVATSPEQVYLPYVAPSLQSPKTPSWLLPMIFGQNTVGRSGGF